MCREENDKYKKQKDLNKELCCVCIDRENNAKLLNCSHYFCDICIDEIASL